MSRRTSLRPRSVINALALAAFGAGSLWLFGDGFLYMAARPRASGQSGSEARLLLAMVWLEAVALAGATGATLKGLARRVSLNPLAAVVLVELVAKLVLTILILGTPAY